MMDLWTAYMQERFGYNYIRREWGFLCYTVDYPSLMIAEIYIHPEHRKSNIALSMFNEIVEYAEKNGFEKIWSQVWTNDKGKERALRMNLAMGFAVQSAEGNCIMLCKTLGGSDGK